MYHSNNLRPTKDNFPADQIKQEQITSLIQSIKIGSNNRWIRLIHDAIQILAAAFFHPCFGETRSKDEGTPRIPSNAPKS